MAKKQIQVVNSQRKESVYEGGRKSVTFICQCVLLEEGEVGVLRVPESFAKEHLDDQGNLPRGVYEIDYCLGVNWQKRDIVGEMCSFEKIHRASNPVGVAASTASAGAGEKAKAA